MSILSNFYSSIYFIFYQIAFITLLLSWQQNNLIKRGKGAVTKQPLNLNKLLVDFI